MTALLATLAFLGVAGWMSGVVWFLRWFRPPSRREPGVVTLILAVTGRTAGLPHLFAALARQGLQPRRLIAAVESDTDPAFAQVAELAPTLPFPVETVVAGLDDTRSQKATNMIAALARIDARDEAVVFLDADIVPEPGWLSALATPALTGDADLVTGYRWHRVEGAGPVRHMVAWLDRAIALGPRFVATGMVWGGSVAVSARALARMDLPGALAATFSTDGAISRRARALGLRVLTRRAVLVPTPPEGGEREAWAFKRRQLQIVRVYTPGLWVAMGVLLHMEACALPLLILALAGDAAAAWCVGLLMLIGGGRAAAHAHVGRAVGVADRGAARLGQLLFGVLAPFSAPFTLALYWASARARRIRWRHVEYEVLGPERVRVLRRHAPGATT